MDETNNTNHFLSNKAYDVVKWLVTIVLPASGTLYFGLAQIWGLPAGEQVVGTIIVFQAFLGLVLGVSTKAYNNSDARFSGSLDIKELPHKDTFLLNLDDHPEALKEKDEVILKVKKQEAPPSR